jgi:hypothetical protein
LELKQLLKPKLLIKKDGKDALMSLQHSGGCLIYNIFLNYIIKDQKKEKILQDICYSPETSLINAKQLYLKVKDKGFTQKQVREFIKNQEINQI